MTSPLEIAVRHLHLGLLWGASLLVPVSERREWSHEWRTELWYVLRECSLETRVEPKSVREATAFCLGAYQDAIWLRKRWWQQQRPLAQAWGSAPVCLALLTGILFAAWGIAHISPRVALGMSRIQVYPWHSSDTAALPCDCPSDLTVGQRSLGTTKLLFDGFSHYKITQEMVADAPSTKTWRVAHARPEFFDVLHLPIRFMDGVAKPSNTWPRVVLGHDTWMRDFGGKPNVVGAKLHVGSVDAIVAGVASDKLRGLPGSADAWLLATDPQIGNGKSEFVIGHLSPDGYFDDGRWALSVGGILFAFLLLPFVCRLSISEYGGGSQRPRLAIRTRFWAFLFAKLAFLLLIVYFASLDLACLLVPPFSLSSEYLQAASSVLLCVIGLRWSLRDQQRRCPVCLRRMTHPVEVGQPSRTFLAWNGTELLCQRGHTLLHIPEISTSWFRTQRWVCLDGSWKFLFARPNRTSSFV